MFVYKVLTFQHWANTQPAKQFTVLMCFCIFYLFIYFIVRRKVHQRQHAFHFLCSCCCRRCRGIFQPLPSCRHFEVVYGMTRRQTLPFSFTARRENESESGPRVQGCDFADARKITSHIKRAKCHSGADGRREVSSSHFKDSRRQSFNFPRTAVIGIPTARLHYITSSPSCCFSH